MTNYNWKQVVVDNSCHRLLLFLLMAWALSQYEKMSLLVGMRRASSVEDTAKCVNIKLSAEDIVFMEDSIKDIQEAVLDK